MKKVKSLLLAGVIAALPLGLAALAQPDQMSRETTETKVVTVTGTVQSFTAGKTITITNPNGEQVTYTINESSEVPKDIDVGKTVTIHTMNESGTPVVKTITITTTTKKKTY